MLYKNGLTEADAKRVIGMPVSAHAITSSLMAQLEASEVLADKFISPCVTGSLLPTDRERSIFGLYYRMVALIKTSVMLDKPIHFQSFTARTAIELMLDAELLHRDLFGDGVKRFHTFTEAQKLRAAKRLSAFLTDRPDLDDGTSEPQKDYIKNNETRIEADILACWGTTKKGSPNYPEHWSQLNMLDRADRIGDDAVTLLVRRYYDLRNFNVHTGLAGVAGLQESGFTIACLLAFEALGISFVRLVKILAKELKLSTAIPEWGDLMTQLDEVSTWAVLDIQLRSLGEPSRLALLK